ncbi:MAG: IclR family transcriptional regulator [Burkholderiaceae bacterium]
MQANDSSGTQAIERAVQLLTTVASRSQLGWRLTDLAAYCDLSNSTTHRILAALTRLRLVKQREGDRRYVPGPMLYDLALTLPAHFAFQAACHPHLVKLAAETKTNVFLSFRSGDSYVLIDDAGTGSATLMSRRGTRRPLLAAATGNAMLLAMPAALREQIMESNTRHIRLHEEHNLDGYLRMYRRSKDCGFGYHRDDVNSGLSSVSVTIPGTDGLPFAGVTAICSTESMPDSRVPGVVKKLRAEAEAIEQQHGELIKALF